MIKLEGHSFSQHDAYLALRNQELLTITILLEYKCNFKCPFCYTLTKNFTDELSFENWKEVVLEAKQLGVKSILIAGAGEPLMVPYIWDLLNFVKANGLDVVLFSNLSLINEEKAQRLIDMDISVIGKINSFNKEVQESIIGNISGAYERMRKGLNHLIEVGYTAERGGKTMLSLETSVLPQNVGEIYDFWVYCRENNIYPLVDTVLYEGSAKDHDYDSFLVDYDVLLSELKKMQEYDVATYSFEWPIRLVKRENGKGIIIGEVGSECQRIGTNLNIDSEGFVYDCFNMSKASSGNVKEKTLTEIFKGRIKNGSSPISVHGLCDCRELVNRDELSKELELCPSCSL